MEWTPLATTIEQPYEVTTTGPDARVFGFDYVVKKYRGRWELKPCSRHCHVYFIVRIDRLDAWRRFAAQTDRSVSVIRLPAGCKALPYANQRPYAPAENSVEKAHFVALVFERKKLPNSRKTCSTMSLRYRIVQPPPKPPKKIVQEVEYQPIPISHFAPKQGLTWEILPPGSVDAQLYQYCRGSGRSRTAVDSERQERLTFLEGLQPLRWWFGISLNGRREYLVAEFERVVVAECPFLGNALFAYRKQAENDWQAVFQKEKRQAEQLGAQRIVHGGNWQQRLRQHLG